MRICKNQSRGPQKFNREDLQKSIAEKFGVKIINTLTGFKYISQKLSKYERNLPSDVISDYKDMSVNQAMATQLENGTFMIFGGEESYGYLACDFTRDKDGNGAVVLFAETAAYAKSLGKSLIELLDDIYLEFGYFQEINKNKVFECQISIASTMNPKKNCKVAIFHQKCRQE